MLLRPQQQWVELMLNLLSKFFRSKELVLDIYAGTVPISKGYLQMPQHARLVGYGNEATMLQDMFSSLVDAYLKLVLSLDSDLARIERAIERSQGFGKEIGAIVSEKKV